MRHLKLKKIKVAKITNISMILGGDARQTIVQGCIPDTRTCPPDKTKDPFNVSCQTTNNGTLAGDPTDGFIETDRCGG
ncbi:MAG: hypothetical protein AAF611_08770 [Bacteroidota bacterium]